jgi:hypothetical protein
MWQDLTPKRVWRVRKRHDHIDAEIRPRGSEWELRILHNGRRLLSWRFADRDEASAEATARRRELERSGWQSHW